MGLGPDLRKEEEAGTLSRSATSSRRPDIGIEGEQWCTRCFSLGPGYEIKRLMTSVGLGVGTLGLGG
jgi:hypothetical protein